MEPAAVFLDRLAITIQKIGGNEAAARAMDKSVKSVERYKTGAEAPFEAIRALAAAARVSLDWLVGDIQVIDKKEKYSTDRLIAVPLMNVAASAGGGTLALEEDKIGFVGFDATWLQQNNLSPVELFTLPTDGESMEPTIKSGEFLLCSKSERHIKPGDGIYVIRLEGDILVKRLQRLPGEKIKVISDNSAYEPYEITLNDGVDFRIMGKVMLVHGVRRL